MVKLSSVTIDLRSGLTFPIGDPPSGESELVCAKGEVCSFVCVTLPDLRRAGQIRVSVVVATDLEPSVPISVLGREVSGTTVGDIPETVMTPGGSKPGHRTAEVTLNADALIRAGVHSRSLKWEWHARVGKKPVAQLGPSRQEVFVLAGPPKAPWASVKPAGPDEHLPWPSALRLATNWAHGAQTPADAAHRIVSKMFELGRSTLGSPPKLKYSGDTSKYVIFVGQPAVFLCRRFIEDIENRPTVFISCIDASGAVTTLASLVGCDLSILRIDGKNSAGFETNCIIPLGVLSATCQVPFAKHQVAATVIGAINESLVYDGVLQVDPDARPAHAGPQFMKPIAARLGGRTMAAGTGVYLPQLVSSADLPHSSVRQHPPPLIKVPGPQRFMLRSDRVRYLRYLRELTATSKEFAPPTRFKIEGYGSGFSFVEEPAVTRALPLLPIPPLRRTSHEPLDGTQKRKLESLFWIDPNREVTRSAMAELLAMADRPPRRVNSNFGPTYLSADHTTLFMLLDGAAAVLQSIGEESVDLGVLLPQVVPV